MIKKNRFPRPKGRGSLVFAQNSLHPRSEDRGFFAQNKEISFKLFVFLILLIIFYYTISLAILTKFPAVNVDEGWLWDSSLLHFNSDFVSMNWPFFSQREDIPFVMEFLLGMVGKIWGIGIFQGRILILAISAMTLGFLFVLTRKLYGFSVAVLAVLFLISTDTFFSGSRVIRADMLLGTFLLVWAYFFLIFIETKKILLLLLASLTLSFGVEVHQNSALFYAGSLFALAILPVNDLKKKIVFFVAYLTGPVLYLIFYIFAHILPNVSAFSSLYRYGLFIDHPLPIFSMGPLEIIGTEIGRYTNYYLSARIFEFGLILLGFIFTLSNKNFKQSFLGHFFFASALMFMIFQASKLEHYFVTFYPIFAIFAARIIDLVAQFPSKIANVKNQIKTQNFLLSYQFTSKKEFRKFAQVVILTLILLFFAFNTFRIAMRIKNYANYDLEILGENINSVIPPDSKIMGLPYWFPVLSNHQFVSFYTLTWYRVLEGKTPDIALSKIKPDILIIDENIRGYLITNPNLIQNTNFQSGLYSIYKPHMENILKNNGKLIKTFEDQFIGPVQIYKLNY